MSPNYKIIFLNQKVGYIFQKLAIELSHIWSPSLIITSFSDYTEMSEDLRQVNAPRYNTRNYFTRVISWFHYFLFAFLKTLFVSRNSLLFIVSNPPILGLIGYILKKTRKQKYVILVYDIHPDLLINTGALKEGLIAKIWRCINRLVWENADAVITIGEYMAQNLSKRFDETATTYGKIVVIHNWADVDWLKPIDKDKNPFIKEYKLENKLVVMFSGNIGATHELETLLEVAKSLKDNDDIRFVIIGDGIKKNFVVDSKEKNHLNNLLILPYLPNNQVPFSLSAADIGVVSMGAGSEAYLVPSRLYFSLAVGNAVISVCNGKCELNDIVTENNCGEVVKLGDMGGMRDIILNYYRNNHNLQKHKDNSRDVAIRKYSSHNIQKYIETVKMVYPIS